MADNRYSSRGDWRDEDRGRGRYGAHDYAHSSYGQRRGRDDEDRGFFERAGEEIRSWFSSDEERDRYERDRYERGQDRDRGWGRSGQSDWQHGSEHGYGSNWGDRALHSRQSDYDRSSSYGRNAERDFGSGESSYGRRFGSEERGYGREHGYGGYQGDYGGGRSQGGFGGQGDWSGRSESSRGYGSGGSRSSSDWSRGRSDDREDSSAFGFSEFAGTTGGFGNQRFGSSQDDHYRSWRDRQIDQLDRDYQDYCREREQQFHQDFDSWRRSRRDQGSGSMSDRISGQQSSSRSGEIGQSSQSSSAALGSSSGSSSSGSGTSGSSSGSETATSMSSSESESGRSGKSGRSK